MGQPDPGTISSDIHQLPARRLGQFPAPCRVCIQKYLTFCNHGHSLLCQQGLSPQTRSFPCVCCVGCCALCCFRSEGTSPVPSRPDRPCPQAIRGPLSPTSTPDSTISSR